MSQATGEEALVTATYSQRMQLQLAAHSTVQARIKGKKLRPVCGDRVIANPITGEPDWLITNILPRDNELTRPSTRGKCEVLAANLDSLVVVTAAVPAPDWFIVDRYLCAAELMHASAAIIFNKTDIDAASPAIAATLAEYAQLDYPVMQSSATTGAGLAQLETFLADRIGIIVGQSGVGKSSIINTLIDSPALRTGTVSASRQEGRHTTVNSEMLELPHGGAVIDSPGVRDYAPVIQASEDVGRCFREVAKYAQQCRFANCRHLREPGCAIKDAVDVGNISARRYESYRRLLALSSRLSEKNY